MTNLYEEDETLWKETQAQLIESGRFDEIDYNSLLQFLLEMAVSDRRSVVGLSRIVVMHLLKLHYQPEKKTRSWFTSVLSNRDSLKDLVSTKTLLNHMVASLEKTYKTSTRWAATETGLPLSTFPDKCPFTAEQILDDDFFAGQLP